jgi:hypothetical protein
VKPEYQEWIDAYKASLGSAKLAGKCGAASEAMALDFPELTVVRGDAVLGGCGCAWSHWWCEDPDGNIVDPTVEQFDDPICLQQGCQNDGTFTYSLRAREPSTSMP